MYQLKFDDSFVQINLLKLIVLIQIIVLKQYNKTLAVQIKIQKKHEKTLPFIMQPPKNSNPSKSSQIFYSITTTKQQLYKKQYYQSNDIKSNNSQETVIAFDDQKIIKEINRQNFQKMLESYSIEDRKFIIVDRTKMRIIDTRQQDKLDEFIKSTANSTIITNNISNLNNISNINNNIFNSNNNLSKVNNNLSNVNGNVSKTNNQVSTSELQYQGRKWKSNSCMKTSIWQQHWKEWSVVHQNFLSSICRCNFPQFSTFLNKRLNPIPIQINFRSQSSWCPIHYASMHSSSQFISRLINHPQIDINILTDFNMTALHIAVQSNKMDNCQLLIGAGVCIDKKDNQGNTPLHYAAEAGYNDIIQLLIANGASQQITNVKNLLPRELCQSQDLLKLFQQPQKDQPADDRFFRMKRNAFVQKMITNTLYQSNTNGSALEQLPSQQAFKKTNKKINQIQTVKQGQKRQLQNQKAQLGSKTANQMRKKNIFKMYQLIRSTKSQPITLSSFKFYKKIGQGAFGQVYVVRRGKSDKMYALKAIKKQRVIGTALCRYIQSQKEILSHLNHPFIVKLHYAFQTEAYLFLVMDYCEGGDLSRLLERKQRLDQSIVKIYAAEILSGLEALHKNMIIYRDLKPQNIVLDRDGHACITDFGLSKKTTDLDALNKSFCGTPAYLPLQIINKKGHTRMADWYQFGIVLYELMTGIPPFYAQTKTQLYDKVRAGVIRFPKNSTQTFRDLIKKLLAQNPQKRLGFQNDADSIKQHQWFKDINWDDVEERKLKVPILENKIKVPTQPIKTKFADIKSQKYNIPSWSFAN